MLANARVYEKEREKVEKYQDLKREIWRLWQLRKVQVVPVVPVVLGVLESVTKDYESWMEKPGVTDDVGTIQRLPC